MVDFKTLLNDIDFNEVFQNSKDYLTSQFYNLHLEESDIEKLKWLLFSIFVGNVIYKILLEKVYKKREKFEFFYTLFVFFLKIFGGGIICNYLLGEPLFLFKDKDDEVIIVICVWILITKCPLNLFHRITDSYPFRVLLIPFSHYYICTFMVERAEFVKENFSGSHFAGIVLPFVNGCGGTFLTWAFLSMSCNRAVIKNVVWNVKVCFGVSLLYHFVGHLDFPRSFSFRDEGFIIDDGSLCCGVYAVIELVLFVWGTVYDFFSSCLKKEEEKIEKKEVKTKKDKKSKKKKKKKNKQKTE